MKQIESVWGFVETCYPNYSNCNDIAENEDLNKILIGEINGNAALLYSEIENELFEINNIFPGENQIIEATQNRLNESYSKIYAKAIEGYIELLKY